MPSKLDLSAMPDLSDGSAMPASPTNSHSTDTPGETVPVGLFFPENLDDVDASGLKLDSQGRVLALVPGGMAARWNEFRKGDLLVRVNGRPFVPTDGLAEYVDPATKKAYLCEVERARTHHGNASLVEQLSPRIFTSSGGPRFTSDAACVEAYNSAGDYQKGLRGKLGLNDLASHGTKSSARVAPAAALPASFRQSV